MKFDELYNDVVSADNATVAEAFSWTDAVKASTYNGTNDHNRYGQTKAIDVDLISKSVRQREEDAAKSPNVLPFPLDGLDEHLSSAYVELQNCRNMLLHTFRSGIINMDEKRLIKNKIKSLNKIMQEIENVAIDIQSMTK